MGAAVTSQVRRAWGTSTGEAPEAASRGPTCARGPHTPGPGRASHFCPGSPEPAGWPGPRRRTGGATQETQSHPREAPSSTPCPGEGAGLAGWGPGWGRRCWPLLCDLHWSPAEALQRPRARPHRPSAVGVREPGVGDRGGGLTWAAAEKKACSRVGTASAHCTTRAQLARGRSSWWSGASLGGAHGVSR